MGSPEPKYDKNTVNPQKTQKCPQTGHRQFISVIAVAEKSHRVGSQAVPILPLGYSSPGPVLAQLLPAEMLRHWR